MSKLKVAWLRLTEWWAGPRKVIEVQGELPPDQLPSRDLVLLREGGEVWSVVMRCPCGCGQPVELPLIREACPAGVCVWIKVGMPLWHPLFGGERGVERISLLGVEKSSGSDCLERGESKNT